MTHQRTLAVLVVLTSSLALHAQAPRPRIGRVTPADLALTTGVSGAAADVVLVRRPGASFLQLRLRDVDLRGGGRIEVHAPAEPVPEVLDSETLSGAGGMTLLHRGDTLGVRLLPGASGVAAARIDLVVEGFPRGGETPLSLCGNDTRQTSTERQVARLVMTETGGVFYGTAFLIDPLKTVATAGHNVSSPGLLSVIAEFDVPASLADGTPQPAALDDQYRWEGPAAMSFEDTAAGIDWAVLRLQRNSQTNAWPAQVQGGYLRLASRAPIAEQTLRVTGCGRDGGRLARNLTQQTATGACVGLSGSELRYRVDTEPGNSGSPVLDADTGAVVGVHVRGGCSAAAGTFNAATANDWPAFAAARVALAGGSADLRVDTLTLPGDTFAAGSTPLARATLGNGVDGSSVYARYVFVLSRTRALDDEARIVSPFAAVRPFIVDVRGIAMISHTLVIPSDLEPGSWWFGMWIDCRREVIEADEGNNVRWLPITITAPPAGVRAIEFQHTLGGMSHETEVWSYTGVTSKGYGALPVQRGGTAPFAVTAPGLAGHWALCAWSGTNGSPFVPDAFTDLSLGNLNSPLFAGWLARLDGSGQTFPSLRLPAGAAPAHPGLYVRVFFVRSDFSGMLGESDGYVTLALR